MDEPGNVPLVQAQNLPGVIFGKIAAEMLYDLPGEVIKQIGMFVIGHIIEIHQAADDVILQPRFFDAALSESQNFS